MKYKVDQSIIYKSISIQEFDKLFTEHQKLAHQIDKLALFIIENIEGEPSKSEGAIDTAIRLLKKAYTQQEAVMVTLYKVTYMVKADTSVIIYTTTTTFRGLDEMLDDTGIRVLGYIKQEEVI